MKTPEMKCVGPVCMIIALHLEVLLATLTSVTCGHLVLFLLLLHTLPWLRGMCCGLHGKAQPQHNVAS